MASDNGGWPVDEVRDGLYMSGQATARKRGAEFDTVVTLCRYDTLGLTEELDGTDTRHLRWPIHDGPLPDLGALHDMAVRLADEVREGREVLVHCASGINRSGLVAALVLRELEGVTGAEAVEVLDERMPRRVLSNRRFREYVEGLGLP